MAWKRGESGNPSGRRPEPFSGPINPEPIHIPILRRRDPASELIKLADASKSERFKKEIWIYLFSEKYKRANVVAKPIEATKLDETSDEDLIKALESGTKPKRVKSSPRAIPVPMPVNDTQTVGDSIPD